MVIFYKIWKKCHEIQFTKNKMDLNKSKIKKHKSLARARIVPTALYGAEAWGIRTAEKRKVNVLEMKCLKSLVGVSRELE